MIFEKAKISKKFPITIHFKLRRSDWYFFPQAWHSTTMAKLADNSYYEIIDEYVFTWLFINIRIRNRLIKK